MPPRLVDNNIAEIAQGLAWLEDALVQMVKQVSGSNVIEYLVVTSSS